MVATAPTALAGVHEDAVSGVLNTYLPGTSGLGRLNVVKTDIDQNSKTITVDVNETGAYIPLDAVRLKALKEDVRNALGKKYNGYNVDIYAVSYDKGQETRRQSFDDLVLFADKAYPAREHSKRFVTDHGRQPAPKGLEGDNLAIWQSHGWYFEPKLNRWEWQRARIFQTVEDLYTQSYVMPYLMPMLENAGAYVMSPRERDTNITEIIVDNDGGQAHAGYSESKPQAWSNTAAAGFGYTTPTLGNNQNPFREGTARQAKAGSGTTAAWNPTFDTDGTYAVYVSYQTVPNSSDAATYTVNSAAGARKFTVNQQMGGGTWIYLGHFPFKAGKQTVPVVTLEATGPAGTVVTADAVKIGGGMGNVARVVSVPLDSIDYKPVTSHYPRFTEGARYFLQWAGAPDSVYTMSGNVNDYNDDYRSRGEWVNWLAGGSAVLPQRDGLGIPVDLAFAFHSDAGTTRNDSIIGTLGIYCTDGREYGDKYADGTSRLASRDLTDLVMTNIVNDIRAKYEPNWTRRGMWDKSYYEARVPQVPTMLLELLSHQNFADMKYGLDPGFRFLVSRAIYKGMGQFLAHREGREFVVQPLPVHDFAISAVSKGKYTLSWQPTPDELEPTAVPTYYLVEERIGDGAFKMVGRTDKPYYEVTVADDLIHSYRITAGNDGGVSFAGEVLALCHRPDAPQVNIVNGFTRISAPDWFEAGDIAGFYDQRDHGVPDGQDISFIGSMFEYRRAIPWMDDDAAGFGASRANYEDRIVAGNTRDYVYTHGVAIRDAGYGFVSTSVGAYMTAPLAGEPANVDLILGKQKEVATGRGVYGTRAKTFPTPLQDKIRQHTAAGGNIFVSGAFVATDLWDNPFSSPELAKQDQEFATGVLGYHWRVGQASVTGQAYQVDTRYKAFTGGEYDFSNEPNEECYAVESPDSFYPADDKNGATFMRYTENNLIAGTAFDNRKYRAVVIGFPFETITGQDNRAHLMGQVLDFMTGRNAMAKSMKTQGNKPVGQRQSKVRNLKGQRQVVTGRPVNTAKAQRIQGDPSKQAQQTQNVPSSLAD